MHGNKKKIVYNIIKNLVELEHSIYKERIWMIEEKKDPQKKDPPPKNNPIKEDLLLEMDLKKLKEIKNCSRCPDLVKTRQQVVVGSGDFTSPLLVIGEAPGEKEDLKNMPFVGRSGELLTNMLQAINLKREKIYITNIVKCRPEKNRNPSKKEIENCSSHLKLQIKMMKPKIIFTLGNFASQFILEQNLGISKIRGILNHYPKDKNIIVLASYHPAALLRNPKLKRESWEDLKKLQEIIQFHCPYIFS